MKGLWEDVKNTQEYFPVSKRGTMYTTAVYKRADVIHVSEGVRAVKMQSDF